MSYFDQPLMQDLRAMVSEGKLGSVVHCYARLMHTGGMTWSKEALEGKSTWRGSVEKTGGGCFIQLAVHYIHIFEWVTGARVVKATGFTNRLHCPGLEGEDIATAVLQLDSGALVTLDTAWCANGEELAIHGTEGRMVYRENRFLEDREVVPPAFGDATNPLNQHRVFLEAARDGKPAPVSIASGVHDMRVVAAVYASAKSGCAVGVK
jgi:predicted dehydrogenase